MVEQTKGMQLVIELIDLIGDSIVATSARSANARLIKGQAMRDKIAARLDQRDELLAAAKGFLGSPFTDEGAPVLRQLVAAIDRAESTP